ncbi:MAG: hypothetical protein H6839_08545 [Planctomycetes bacterium]|nr:hypothetical protein [Planctomycetota bacterium]
MGSARDFIRVEVSKTKYLEKARAGFAEEVARESFDGKYYRVSPEVKRVSDDQVSIKAISKVGELQVGVMTFDLKTGQSDIKWFNEDPDQE